MRTPQLLFFLCVYVGFETKSKAGLCSQLQLVANIKDKHSGEHLRLIVVAGIKLEETFEASFALYLFCHLLVFAVCICMYYLCTCVPPYFVFCSLLPLFIKTYKTLSDYRHHVEALMQTQHMLYADLDSCPP